MELKYQGKTKDVFQLDNGNFLLQFKDDVTGVDGKFDPGANQVGLSISGMGLSNIIMTTYFFELLNAEGFPTHFVKGDREAVTLEVIPAKAFGQGLEVITRYRAVGSFYRRYGAYIAEGSELPTYTEFTLKDDLREDPLVTPEGLQVLNILTAEEYDTLYALNQRIADRIREELASKGIELYDLKLEYGKRIDNGEIILIDEISGGNMRAYQDGKYIDPMTLAHFFA